MVDFVASATSAARQRRASEEHFNVEQDAHTHRRLSGLKKNQTEKENEKEERASLEETRDRETHSDEKAEREKTTGKRQKYKKR